MHTACQTETGANVTQRTPYAGELSQDVEKGVRGLSRYFVTLLCIVSCGTPSSTPSAPFRFVFFKLCGTCPRATTLENGV